MGNDGACKVVEIGDVHLFTSTGYMMVLKNVRHVPDIRLNLISRPDGSTMKDTLVLSKKAFGISVREV